MKEGKKERRKRHEKEKEKAKSKIEKEKEKILEKRKEKRKEERKEKKGNHIHTKKNSGKKQRHQSTVTKIRWLACGGEVDPPRLCP